MLAPFIVGVDGGATKTHLAVADAKGNLLAVHEAGGTYYKLTDAAEQMEALLWHLRDSHLAVAVFTVAGWDFEEDQQRQRRLIERALATNNITADKIIYENDLLSTLKSAYSISEPCVVISCGTGIIGLAAYNGTYYKTPGYEYLSGEWGSGIHQAEYAIHLACASLLGREEPYPILIQKALHYFGANDVYTLAHSVTNKFSGNQQRGYFLKPVYEAYHEGCPGAARVIHRAGEELARTVWCLLKQLPQGNVPIIFSGGVIRQFGLPPNFKQALFQLTQQYFECYELVSPPVYGALHWALQEGNYPTDKVDEQLKLVRLI